MDLELDLSDRKPRRAPSTTTTLPLGPSCNSCEVPINGAHWLVNNRPWCVGCTHREFTTPASAGRFTKSLGLVVFLLIASITFFIAAPFVVIVGIIYYKITTRVRSAPVELVYVEGSGVGTPTPTERRRCPGCARSIPDVARCPSCGALVHRGFWTYGPIIVTALCALVWVGTGPHETWKGRLFRRVKTAVEQSARREAALKLCVERCPGIGQGVDPPQFDSHRPSSEGLVAQCVASPPEDATLRECLKGVARVHGVDHCVSTCLNAK